MQLQGLFPGIRQTGFRVRGFFRRGIIRLPTLYPPEVLDGMPVPEVLMSGHHEQIRKWRLEQSLERTWLRRPELLDSLALTDEQRVLLAKIKKQHKIS